MHACRLAQAWSSIVVSLIPNVGVVESHLEKFCHIIEADEVFPPPPNPPLK